MEKKTVLVGSPVRQKHPILARFLQGLDEVDKADYSVSYYFVDDNTDEESSALLRQFAAAHEVVLRRGEELTGSSKFGSYVSDEVTHIWDTNTITKVAFFKDTIIEYALEKGFDYLFFVDSDIVVDRRTLRQLASRDVEIVSNVFWTQWKPNWQLEPQCFWMPALSYQERKPFSGAISREEARQIQKDFFAKMRVPGLYKVDGLGACTLIARSALEKGVRFKEIPNLSLLGEDRHFCIRAGALGISLYFDTVYPVYHIYREEYLSRVDEFRQFGFRYDMCQTFEQETKAVGTGESELRRILKRGFGYLKRKLENRKRAEDKTSLVYDRSLENDRIEVQIVVDDVCLQYLEETINSVRNVADHYVFFDNTTTDTFDRICTAILQDQTYAIVRDDGPEADQNPYAALWQKAEKFQPGWVLALRAGEVMPEEAETAIRHLIRNNAIDSYRFKKYDMWSQDEYRDDDIWNGSRVFRTYLMRYQSGHHYHWRREKTDDERFPAEVETTSFASINLRIKDFRWAREEDRKTAYAAFAEGRSGDNGDSERRRSLIDGDPQKKRYDDLPKEL